MKITLYLDTDVAIALRRFAVEANEDLDAAAKMALREYLISIGMLELSEGDSDDD